MRPRVRLSAKSRTGVAGPQAADPQGDDPLACKSRRDD
jgi:hypothetical protein